MSKRFRTCVVLAALSGCARGALAPAAAPAPAPPERRSELALEVALRVSGSRDATLRSGEEVMSGDGIQVVVVPTVDARVYVAYCDGTHQLTMFPGRQGIEAKAGAVVYAPARDARIVLDDQVGPEVLYVIASRRPIDLADPMLAAAISRASPEAVVECDASFERVLDGGSPIAGDAAAPAPVEPAALSSWSSSSSPSSSPSPSSGASPSSGSRSQPSKLPPHPPQQHASRVPPPAELQRGGFIRWDPTGVVSAGAAADDIAVLRYSFRHVARPSPASP